MKLRSIFTTAGLLPFAILSLASCTTSGEQGHDENVGQVEQNLFVNGDFEEGTDNQPPPHWEVRAYANPGVTYPPLTRAHLNLGSPLASPGNRLDTVIRSTTNGPESQVDPTLGAGASLRWPKYGNQVAVVNRQGSSNTANSLRQVMTLSTADIDPMDGKAHVRFTVAPVLDAAGHGPAQQPYYFVYLRNITKNIVLYQDFNASEQPGIPWKVGAGGVNYTDWQLVDIAPGDAQMAVGDQIELEVIASRCSPTAHFGRVYVDGVGPTIPGLYVSGTGPSAANAGDEITYQLSYSNGGTGAAGGVVINFNVPDGTTWVGLNAPGLSCTQPSPGATGQASCTVGALAPGAGGSFTTTVRINPGASGVITAGNYEILGTGITPLLGPKVFTNVTSGVTYADLGITKTNNVGGVAWGQPVTYTIVATNYGPSPVTNATVSDTMPTNLTGVTWSCSASSGSSCGTANGSGNINTTVSLPVGGTATFQVNANVVAGSGSGTLSNTVTIAPPSGVSDTNPTNDAGVDTDMIGTLQSLTVSKYGGSGTITSTPSAINCGPSCTSAEGAFVNGMTVTLNAVPAPGETFQGWGGACSGTSTSCTLTISGNQWIAAIFETIPRANGEACASAGQCTSGFCADGVCCNSACGDSATDCQSCAVSGSVGTCTVLTQGTECAAASCSAGVLTAAATCDGSSTVCPSVTPVSCGGHVCDGSACMPACTSHAECVSGNYCDDSGACQPLAPQGDACTASDQCGSGHCVDGVCCNTACTGQCEACNLEVAPGVCLPATGAPVGSRPACDSAAEACGGSCNGTLRLACAYPATETACGLPSCAGGVATLAALCNGAGDCSPPATQPCSPFVCGETACEGDCSADDGCVDERFCSAGVCEEKLDPGASCDRDRQCESGHCVDGVCCNTACEGQCEACNVGDALGACSPVTGAPRGTRPECAGGSSTCAGSCDGTLTTACAYPDADVECRAASCADGVATLAAGCDGAGACPDVQTQACGEYVCGENICNGDCTTDAECSSGNFCSAGVCVEQLDPGSTCAGENQCASGHCVDGVCCDTACTGQCEACDVTGSEGTCSPVTGAPHGARTACATDGSACGGTCDGTLTTACAYPETECRTASCSSGVATLAASCDGQGTCPEPMQQSCGNYVCGETSCNGDCSENSDCESGNYCSGGVCVPERDDGRTCLDDEQCESGHCVDGVCCDTACEGQCAACNLDGSRGTCSAVEGTPRGGRAPCLGQGECAGSCDGTTLESCTYPGSETTCREASCSQGTETSSAQCNGEGLCSESTTESCGNYACGDNACATSCESAAQCASGMYCVDGACSTEPPQPDIHSRSGVLEGGGFGCSVQSTQLTSASSGLGWLFGIALSLGIAGARRRRSQPSKAA